MAWQDYTQVLLGGGQFNGSPSPKKMAGKYFHPPHLRPTDNATTMSTVAARYYIVPFYIEETTTFAGSWCWNAGTGDSGDKIKMALYAQKTGISGVAGGPGARVKDFGEVTLGATAALRNFAAAVTLEPGWYYLEIVTNAVINMYAMGPVDSPSNVGFVLPNTAANLMGSVASPLNSSARGGVMAACDYLSGTYANFPESTSLVPSATAVSFNECPFCGLYT